MIALTIIFKLPFFSQLLDKVVCFSAPGFIVLGVFNQSMAMA